ncbi:hypothetical protein BHE74_00008965 [Ensete ventricosum]|uniref:Uncharacterized protein n=1 Tax=Ensete ventricosum TaxID=4639 RepID=A0A444FE27_ENSVE|nr:hypothetical protein B296_00008496 [Ensete ventricosum]RWW20891.1 hypothetical protein GW17_00014973 [Ensete ventricosum]RWW82565.1 hypothetical protein BHE74_00008965 [Ensete ventricosum]
MSFASNVVDFRCLAKEQEKAVVVAIAAGSLAVGFVDYSTLVFDVVKNVVGETVAVVVVASEIVVFVVAAAGTLVFAVDEKLLKAVVEFVGDCLAFAAGHLASPGA